MAQHEKETFEVAHLFTQLCTIPDTLQFLCSDSINENILHCFLIYPNRCCITEGKRKTKSRTEGGTKSFLFNIFSLSSDTTESCTYPADSCQLCHITQGLKRLRGSQKGCSDASYTQHLSAALLYSVCCSPHPSSPVHAHMCVQF